MASAENPEKLHPAGRADKPADAPAKPLAPHSGAGGAESARRILVLLMSFTEENHTQTVGEMAAYLDAPVSTIYRYVALLRELGLLEETGRGRYRVTLRVLGLARAAQAGSGGLPAIIRPFLDQLAEETRETALLFRRLEHAVVAIDQTESSQSVRLRSQRGALMSLHHGAAGRVLLSALSVPQREAYYRSVRETQGLVAVPSDSELATIAEEGWTESFGQVEEGIWGCAAAIRDQRGVVAALGVAGPLYRLDDVHRAQIVAAVRRAAGEINTILAGPDTETSQR